MSQPKSNEKIVKKLANEIHSTFASAYALNESVSHEWLKNTISKALAQKDAEVAEAIKAERERIINLAEGEPYIYVPNITEANPSTK